jgi:hypothetical protein
MTPAAVLAAALLAQAPAPPDLSLHPGERFGPGRALEQGPFTDGELIGASVGVLAGDAAVFGVAYGMFHLFTSGTISPTATHFRNAAVVLAASALILPPLGATVGGSVARVGPARGAPWKAFLLSLVGHAIALGVGYGVAPSYWAILPVQVATMSAATSFGLHWGRAPQERPVARPEAAPTRRRATGAEVAAYLPPLCLDEG